MVAVFSVIFLLSSSLGFAKSSLLKPGFPSFAKVGEEVQFEPLDGHHFNVKAPQYCGEAKAKKVLEHELICVFKKSGTHKVNLKVCDNKKTFCKSERAEVTILDSKAKK